MNDSIKTIRETIGLLNSMICCGDTHSERSKQQVEDGLLALKQLEKALPKE